MATSDTLIDTVFDGRYRILRRLGTGGMANVYLAEDTELGRRVAIKILNDRYAHDDLFVERFRREAKSAAGLSHPNIVSIYDRGEAEGTYYIAMEVIEGASLKDLIRANERLRPAQAVSYTRQVLSALRFAHRHGVIHRDIKPHNILIGHEERLKVADFGIARAGASQMTEAGSVMGTAHYLSPEQARGAQVTASSDLYSVGVMLYEMLTGQVPFSGDTPVEIAMKHLNEPPRPPSALAPGIPADLDRIALRALAKDPASRYQSAEEFDSDLARIEAGLPIARETEEAATAVLAAQTAANAKTQALPQQRPPARVPPRRPPYDPYARPPRRKRSFLPWLLVILLLTAAAVAGWYVYQQVQDQLSESKPVPVPLVTGIKEQRAIDLLTSDGLKTTVERRADDEVEAGFVIQQDPQAGTRIAKGETVVLTVSTGVEQIEVPELRGKSQGEAVQILADANLRWKIVERFSAQDPGTVLAQDPACWRTGGEGLRGHAASLEGDQAGRRAQRDRARSGERDRDPERRRLRGQPETVASDSAAGTVVGQSPSGGTAPQGSDGRRSRSRRARRPSPCRALWDRTRPPPPPHSKMRASTSMSETRPGSIRVTTASSSISSRIRAPRLIPERRSPSSSVASRRLPSRRALRPTPGEPSPPRRRPFGRTIERARDLDRLGPLRPRGPARSGLRG